MSVIRHWSDCWTRNEFAAEVERLRLIADTQGAEVDRLRGELSTRSEQLRGAVEGWERAAKLAEWIIRDRREADKVTAYAGELAALASRHGGQ